MTSWTKTFYTYNQRWMLGQANEVVISGPFLRAPHLVLALFC